MRTKMRYALAVTRSGRERRYKASSEAKARADADEYLELIEAGRLGYESVRILQIREEVSEIWAG